MEPGVECQGKRGEIPVEVKVYGEKMATRSVESEREFLLVESSSAGTGVMAPKQPRLSCKEMQPTAIGGCRLAGGTGSERGTSSSLLEPSSMSHSTKHQKSPPLTKLRSCRWTGCTERWRPTGNNTNGLALEDRFGEAAASSGELPTSPKLRL